MADKNKSYLTGHLLLAMPTVGDPRFHKAVIFMAAHDDKGAMGIVVNKTVPGVNFTKLLEQFNVKTEDITDSTLADKPVMAGGPVETSRGFLLHSRDFVTNDTIRVSRDFSVSGTVAALKACAAGRGPQDFLFALGYAGWDPGQLEREIQDNVWLTATPTGEMLFHTETDMMWERIMAQIGVNPAMLSSTAGHA